MSRCLGQGCRGERESKREGIYVYIERIHFIAERKATQHCKAVVLQLKYKLYD